VSRVISNACRLINKLDVIIKVILVSGAQPVWKFLNCRANNIERKRFGNSLANERERVLEGNNGFGTVMPRRYFHGGARDVEALQRSVPLDKTVADMNV
jgi:hypothetical protein